MPKLISPAAWFMLTVVFATNAACGFGTPGIPAEAPSHTEGSGGMGLEGKRDAGPGRGGMVTTTNAQDSHPPQKPEVPDAYPVVRPDLWPPDVRAPAAPVDAGAGNVCVSSRVLSSGSGGSFACAILPDTRAACFGGPRPRILEWSDGGEVKDVIAVATVNVADEGFLIVKGGSVHGWRVGTKVERKPVIAAHAVAVTGGYMHACALIRAPGQPNHVQCWGETSGGKLGTTQPGAGPLKVELPHNDEPIQISASYKHSCALLASKSIRCWGSNSDGQLGVGTTNTESPLPVEAKAVGGPVRAVSAGQLHTCVLVETGAVKCWGNGFHGGLGIATPNNDNLPAPGVATYQRGVLAVSAGKFHSCFLLESGQVSCSGNGNAAVGGHVRTPAPVPGVAAAVELATGHNYSCALANNGQIRCWGDTYGGPTPVLIVGRDGQPVVAAVPAPCF